MANMEPIEAASSLESQRSSKGHRYALMHVLRIESPEMNHGEDCYGEESEESEERAFQTGKSEPEVRFKLSRHRSPMRKARSLSTPSPA
jgi:hypothetical protein